MPEQLPVAIARCQVLSTGAIFPEDMTVSEWMMAGRQIDRVVNKIQFTWGDWLNFGERKYGERYKIACEESGIDYQTLANYSWTCSKIEISRRRENLPFGHHIEVAALEPEEQDKWLSDAESNGWSVSELRARLRSSLARFSKEDHGKPVKTFVGYLTNAIRLIGQQSEHISLWSPEQKYRTKEMLRPLVEFYEKL